MRRFLLISCIATVVACVILHLAGARACVGILSGTMPASDGLLVIGLGYAAAWFGSVVIVPIVTLALILDHVCGRLVRWRRSPAR